MENNYDILVFSIFGRNTWLAAQLRALGYTVAFMDLTSLFQKGLPEDWEGPFPYIFTDQMERSYCQSLTDQDAYEVLLRGPSLKVQGQGLFEFKADHAPYLLQKWQQEGLWFFEEDEAPMAPSKTASFQSLWLKAFLKEWRATSLRPLSETLAKPILEFPLNSHYVVRHPTKDGFLNSSRWLETVGVDIIPVSAWWKCGTDSSSKKWVLKFDNDVVKAKADHFILGLSSYELHRFSGQLDLGENNVKVPKGFWTRWSGQCAANDKLDYIPSYSMFLTDIEMGLCNENLITLIKRPNKQLDIWACVTAEVLSQQGFLDQLQVEVTKKLKTFVPELHDLKLEGPKLGSDLYSFWPVYDDVPTAQLKGKKPLILDSPESWMGLDNYSRYISQKNIIQTFKDEIEIDKGASL